MNRSALVTAIGNAVRRYGEVEAEIIAKHGGRVWAELTDQLCIEALAPDVEPVLSADPRLKTDDPVYIRSECGYSSLAPHYLAPKLIKKAMDCQSTEAAADWLDKILSTQAAVGLVTMALWGVSTPCDVDLGGGVLLRPFSALPESPQKNGILNQKGHEHSLRFQPISVGVPTAALVIQKKIAPVVFRKSDCDPNLECEERGVLEEVRLALTVIGPSPVVPAYIWFHYEDSDFERALLGSGTGWPHIEVMPMHFTSLGEFCPATAIEVTRAFLGMPAEPRKKVRRALERLNQGLRRLRPGDALTDIAIALESVLASGSGENTHKVSIRSALILGGTLAERRLHRSIVGAAYSARNTMVHAGELDNSPFKLDGGVNVVATELVKRAAMVCAGVLTKIVVQGRLPDWYDLELGASNTLP